MPNAYPAPVPLFRDWGNDGNPLVNGQLYSYQAGTTTPLATYTDSTAGTPNANPVILNSRGEGNVWLLPNTGYKFILKDSAGNTIWSADQIFNSQLITLYGGVDTGIMNAYQIAFTANFTAYTNGIIIYWIPANTNTGASTINVNGLGAVAILNQDGTALGPGQIVAGGITAIMYYSGNFLLTSSTGSVPKSGTFLATATGGTFAPANGTCTWTINGTIATITLFGTAGTSSVNTFTYTGLPTILQPTTQVCDVPIAVAQNNGAYVAGVFAQISPGSGTIQFGLLGNFTGWTTGGVIKGIGYYTGATYQKVCITYSLV